MLDPDQIAELRAAVGAAAMGDLDFIDEELMAALYDYVPALTAMAEHLRHWPMNQRTRFLVNMALQAGLEA